MKPCAAVFLISAASFHMDPTTGLEWTGAPPPLPSSSGLRMVERLTQPCGVEISPQNSAHSRVIVACLEARHPPDHRSLFERVGNPQQRAFTPSSPEERHPNR